MKLSHKLDSYRERAETFLAERGYKLEDVRSGQDAWTVAHKSGITSDAYGEGRDVKDGHIQTALGAILPNVTFNEERRY